ncbi:MAG TPA: hypothetical protein VID48_00880 [Solirubrobacteraceae bacterium]
MSPRQLQRASSALLGVTALGALVAHSSKEHGDQQEGVQAVFLALLAIPPYVLRWLAPLLGGSWEDGSLAELIQAGTLAVDREYIV